MSLVLIVPEHFGARGIEDIPGPSPGAVHTLGVVDRIEEVGLNTLPAHIKITERANGLFMIYFVKLFTTNVALCHLVLLMLEIFIRRLERAHFFTIRQV